MEIEIRGTVLHSMMMNDALMMNLHTLHNDTVPYDRIISTPKLGVRAVTLLNYNSTTEIVDVDRLSYKEDPIFQYVEIADVNGRLLCVDGLHDASSWMRTITIAKDSESSNVILMITAFGVMLKTLRIIIPGEPLLMWFTDNILQAMNIRSLGPANLHGGEYLCTICYATFSHPNPLKIHIALNCNKLHPSSLWLALAQQVQSSPFQANFLNCFPTTLSGPFGYESYRYPPQGQEQYEQHRHAPKLSPSVMLNSTRSELTPYSASAPLESSPSSRDVLAFVSSVQATLASSSNKIDSLPSSIMLSGSAFQPYRRISNVKNNRVENNHVEIAPPRNADVLPSVPIPPHSYEQSAEFESLLSTLAKSKRLHRCIYCGKGYSRKYGLKIHIRTHTGYKPLRCTFCLRRFGDPSNLNKHVRLHIGDESHTCRYCKKVLVRNRDLQRHLKSRHGIISLLADHHSKTCSN